MRYMLTIAGDEGARDHLSPEERQAGLRDWQAFTDEIRASGAYIAGDGLAPSATAKTVHIPEDGEPTTTDGPFAETKEQIGGFYLIEVDGLDQAIEWGKKVPARGGMVEVRAVMDYEAAGVEDPNRAETTA